MKKIVITLLLALGSRYCFAQYWDSLQGGLNQPLRSMYVDSLTDQLIVGGNFYQVDHQLVKGIASWKNGQWDSLGHGIDNCPSCGVTPFATYAIKRYDSCIYIGGSFRTAGNVVTPAFARWNGMDWDSVPGGKISQYGAVRDIDVFNNELYICGAFDSIGNISANAIAKWDGTTWSWIGSNYVFAGPSSGVLTCMSMYENCLYVGGSFDDPQGNFCHLAKWDGQNWQFFTSELQGGIVDVWDMEVYNNELYVSGLFYMSAGCAGTSIVRWNDTIWRDVGGSVEIYSSPYPTVKDMCVHNGLLYCVGNFERIGGVEANYVASWDGLNWCGYGTSYYGGVEKIEFYHDTMYVGGGFIALEGDTAWAIAKWIGGGPDTCGNTTGITESPEQLNLNVFPNPSGGSIWIQGPIMTGEEIIIEVYGANGQLMYHENLSARSYINKPLLLTDYSAGIYIVEIRSGEKMFSSKILIQH